ncbi:hypothetical protein [Microbacterium gorillae]|uniref:hypothetical protein n=1 Tax=Microbacterium gorillae TaxID=1231063 RepID=UPI00058CD8BB|nr:hypothetical protein [Microbacterium gorillae]
MTSPEDRYYEISEEIAGVRDGLMRADSMLDTLAMTIEKVEYGDRGHALSGATEVALDLREVSAELRRIAEWADGCAHVLKPR